MEIIEAQSKTRIEAIRLLFREYEAFLDVDLCFQGFEEELAELPGRYAPPDGVLLLAVENGQAAGCGALRRIDAKTCEMKRLFVRPAFRGRRLGRALAQRLIIEAVARGYEAMLLDTLDKLKAAVALYRDLGFEQTEPYYGNPLPGVLYWRLELNQAKAKVL
jgi:putative acetyltransferase